MRTATFRATAVALLLLLYIPSTALGQITRIVVVKDDFFDPGELTIQVGDTVLWVNPPGENLHNIIADDMSFDSGAPSRIGNFSHTFTEAGVYPYHCELHAPDGMTGTITVEGGVVAPFDIDPGHSGNWWNGPARDGEGAQVEVSDGGNGNLVFVVTFYSYGPAGGQIFLVGVGTPQGDGVDVEIFITDGGAWGEAFDPDDVDERQWGSGRFTAKSCDRIHMFLEPNLAYQTEGYTPIEYDLVRLTTPAIPCPYEQ